MSKKSALILLLIAGAIRISGSANDSFPFMYDHAKDALALLKMSVVREPVLSGAVTSIPGVFNGPAPLYLFLPAFVLTGNHPFGSVATVIVGSLIASALLWRRSTLAGAMYAVSAAAVGSQTSAWYPYLTGIFMVPVVLLLLHIRDYKNSHLRSSIFLVLGLFIGLLFHAQTAFGIVMLPATVFILLLHKQSLRRKNWIAFLAAFISTFIPFFLFELRNDFHQLKSILIFLQNFPHTAQQVSPTPQGLSRVFDLTQNILTAFGSSISPIPLHPIISGAIFILVIQQSLLIHRTFFSTFWLPLTGIPFLLYMILPFKPYYLVGMIPIFIVWFTETVFWDSQHLKRLTVVCIVSIGLLQNLNLNEIQRISSNQSINSFSAKEAAVTQIIQWSESKPYESVQLVPEVYDYPYQFLFLKSALEDTSKPVRFHYSPNAPEYVSEKAEILSKIPHRPTEAMKLFVISEISDPENEIAQLFPKSTIVRSVAIQPQLRVFELKN